MSIGPLAPLAAWRQFILVRLVPRADGRTDKLPMRMDTMRTCDAHDPCAWSDYDTAAAMAAALGSEYAVGFVLTAADPWFCLDLDGCAEPGGWSALAQSIVGALPGCVTEVSQSGKGLHLWGRRSAMPAHTSKNIPLHIELYSSLRFIALGHSRVGTLSDDCTAIDAVAAQYFPPRAATVAGDVPDEGPRADWRGPADDAELLRRALQSRSARSAFGGGASFADLWHADESALERAYPADRGSQEPYDRSSADAALAQHLAFWAGCDVARMERLMRQSALARDKWDDRPDYLVDRTIRGACAQQREVLQDAPSAVPEPTVAAAHPTGAMVEVEGNTFLGPSEQIKLFAGCTYVVDAHRALVPGGHMLKPDQFRAKFGGYSFAMDGRNEKVSRNAWEAFTESQVLRRPMADGTCFRPDLPFGTLVTDAGRVRANTYWPLDVPCAPGDVSRFMAHLTKLLPDPRDRTICLSYMAFIVQYPGIKAQWSVLLQGVEGNGKTVLSRCLAEAVGRRYAYWPKAKKIAAQFNSWLFGHLVFLVEDIHTGADSDVLDELKPMITGGDGLEIEAKGVDQTTREICGNFFFNSNHKNAIKKTRNDRRFCVLFCAQQDVADLVRDGMGPEYMAGLYDWLKLEGGYAAVTHMLKGYDIPDEFNPAGKCQRAPVTTSTEAAIEQSMGSAEQEVSEAIDAGDPGFRGGWVSSKFLDLLLDRVGKSRAVPLNRRRDMMRGMGYDWHPALRNGRVDNTVLPDASKPRLYLKIGHPDMALTARGEVAKAYSAAQVSA